MCKGIIVKRNVFVHLKGVFPKFLELIESYDTPAFYANEYSIDQKGRKKVKETGGSPEGKGHNEEEEEEGEGDDDDDDEKGASTYKSRAPLLALLKSLAKNRLERTLANMGKGMVSNNSLDLTSPEALPLQNLIQGIAAAYAHDFPPPVQLPPEHLQVHTTGGSGQSVHVQVEPAILDEISYKDKLEEYNHKVTTYESQQLGTYVSAHIHTVFFGEHEAEADLAEIIHCA